MTKDHGMFTPGLPSDEVQRFLKENPVANWEESLVYLMDKYPQVKKEGVQWVVEGGAAVRLHNPHRQTPNDVDIISMNFKMKEEFSNSKRFDIKTLQDWFNLRDLEYTQETGDLLLSNTQFIDFRGKPLLLLNPIALVVSKTISTHRHALHRPEDKVDIELLSVNPQLVSTLTQQITRRK